MPWTSEHLSWLKETGTNIQLKCGKKVKIYTFSPDTQDESKMSLWAKHFRNHYCLDSEIDILKRPNQSRSDYLTNIKFPDFSKAPGPSIRSGDFAEILVADYLRYLCSYWVPKTRYDSKEKRNKSTQGSDVIAMSKELTNSINDELLIYEVKAKLSESRNRSESNLLQTAINDSSKDEIRLAESLNAMKQRFFDRREINKMKKVERFQDPIEKPYTQRYGAVSVYSNSNHVTDFSVDINHHPYHADLDLLAIRGQDLMNLAHQLYERAANEA